MTVRCPGGQTQKDIDKSTFRPADGVRIMRSKLFRLLVDAVILLKHILYNYYRAMPSADCAVTRTLSVRPSVCHTPVFCRNG